MKRVTMGGTDAVVTDDGVADRILEYARELGRTGTTDTVTIPAAMHGASVEASMLLGPASQITVTPELGGENAAVQLADLEGARSDLQDRIDRLTGRLDGAQRVPDVTEAFVDFDRYDQKDV